jgi:hypothetical protein
MIKKRLSQLLLIDFQSLGIRNYQIKTAKRKRKRKKRIGVRRMTEKISLLEFKASLSIISQYLSSLVSITRNCTWKVGLKWLML